MKRQRPCARAPRRTTRHSAPGSAALVGAATLVAALALAWPAMGTASTAVADAGALSLSSPAAGTVFFADSNSIVDARFSGSAPAGQSVAVSTIAAVDAATGDETMLCTTVAIADGAWACSASSMPDFHGPVFVRSGASEVSEALGALNPPVIDIPAPGVPTTDATVSGTAAPLAQVAVLRGAAPGCTASASSEGTWSCVLALTDADSGISELTASQSVSYSGDASAPSPPVAFDYQPVAIVPIVPVVPVPPDVPATPFTPAPLAAPAPPAASAGASASATSATTGATSGDRSARSASGASATPEATTPTADAAAQVPANGAPAPQGGDEGAAESVPGATAGSGRPDAGSTTAQGPPLAGSASGPATDTAAAAGADASWASPTLFGTSLRSFGSVSITPAAVAAMSLVAAGLLCLLALPAELLQSTLRENYDRLGPLVTPVERALATLRRRIPGSTSSGQRQLALVVGAATIMSFADPTTGIDARTLRLVLALTLILFVVNYAGVWATRIHAYSAYRATAGILLRPWALALMVVTVLVSHFSGLQPGIVFGLILGAEVGAGLGGEARRHGAAKLAVTVTLVMLALGVSSWLLYSALGLQNQVEPTFGSQLLAEVLSGLTVEALTAPVVALVPLTFLDGRPVFAWSKPGWVCLYSVAATTFVLVLLPMPSTWVEVPSLLSPWAIASGVFTAVSVAVWAYFRWSMPPPNKRNAEAPAGTDRSSVSNENVNAGDSSRSAARVSG
ncbi:hypothetical protein BH09ACT6_BH09ACT6_12730 [soil metagenome]